MSELRPWFLCLYDASRRKYGCHIRKTTLAIAVDVAAAVTVTVVCPELLKQPTAVAASVTVTIMKLHSAVGSEPPPSLLSPY